jgi:putative oxidoreductase
MNTDVIKPKAATGARLLLGLIFLVFGLNGFFNFLPQPQMEGKALDFIMALVNTGYMFPVIKGIEVLASILLLTGIAVPLALLLLAPIVTNILLFHTFLDFNPGLPIVIVLLGLFIAWNYKERFIPLFRK